MKQIPVEVEELVRLKESGMSDREIANLISEKEGKMVKANTVSQKLIRYYKSEGKEKPNKHSKKKEMQIPIEEIVKLKEEDMSDEKIVEQLKLQGIKVSKSTVCNRLTEYYESREESKPKVKSGNKKGTRIKEVPIEEIVKLKEAKMSTAKIVEHLASKGIEISAVTVEKRLDEYYETIGRKKPRGNKELPIEEIVRLKKLKMPTTKIVEYLASKGIQVSTSTISKRLAEYYETMGEENVNARTNVKVIIPKEKYDNSIKHILMNGMTIDEYITEIGKEDERKNIEIKLRKLEFLAGYSDTSERTMGN